jgi:hypothetical protein
MARHDVGQRPARNAGGASPRARPRAWEPLAGHGISRALARLVSPRAFRRPIFILSSPRSGSSYLHTLMQAVFPCWGSPRENDAAWWRLFPYERNGYTDAVTLGRFRERADPARLREELALSVISRRGDEGPLYLARHRLHRSRFLDKTVANAFHLEVLAHAFPDASYVYLLRDGRATIASMIEAWLSGSFMRRQLPLPEGATVSHWTFPVPRGWEAVCARPLPEICAWSWMEHHRAVQDGIERLGLRQRTVEVRYEQLLADRGGTLAALAGGLGFSWSPDLEERAMQVGTSWATVSDPREDKWRETRSREVESVLPMIADALRRLGYE